MQSSNAFNKLTRAHGMLSWRTWVPTLIAISLLPTASIASPSGATEDGETTYAIAVWSPEAGDVTIATYHGPLDGYLPIRETCGPFYHA